MEEVRRTRVIKAHLSKEEKTLFDELVRHFGMFQQDVLTRIIVWWMNQPKDFQLSIVRDTPMFAPKRVTYEYKRHCDWKEGNPDSEDDLNDFGKDGWELIFTKQELVSTHPDTGGAGNFGTVWYFKRLV